MIIKHPDLKLTPTSLLYVIQELKSLPVEECDWRIKISRWDEKRTLSANAQIHVFVAKIAEFTNTDAKTVKSEVKIDFGLPILLAREDEYSTVLDWLLTKGMFYDMKRESQCKFITAIQVTSVMTVKESKLMMDDMIYYWNDKGLDIGFIDK